MNPTDEIFRAPSRIPLRVAGFCLLGVFILLLWSLLPLVSFWADTTAPSSEKPRLNRLADYSVPPLPPTLRIGGGESKTPPPTVAPKPSAPEEQRLNQVSKETLLLLPEAMQPKDPQILADLEKARVQRESGDTPGSMETLRDLEKRIPEHPLLLFQLAETSDALGMDPLAMDYWTRLRDLGEEAAGDYAAYAAMHLTHENHTVDSVKLEDAYFEIGPVRATQEMLPGEEDVNLSVPIELNTAEPIDAAELEVYVYFFEILSNGQVVQSDSEDMGGPSVLYRWEKTPDWHSGPETLEVEYRRALPTDAVAHRKFHGYIVRVFYSGRLQDVTARPRTLFDIQLTPQPTTDDAPPPSGSGPDSALFPNIP